MRELSGRRRWPYPLAAALVCSGFGVFAELLSTSQWADLLHFPTPLLLVPPAGLAILGVVLGVRRGWDHRTAWLTCAAALAATLAGSVIHDLSTGSGGWYPLAIPLLVFGYCVPVFLGLLIGARATRTPVVPAGSDEPAEFVTHARAATAAIADPKERTEAVTELLDHANSRYQEALAAGAEPSAAVAATLAELGDPAEAAADFGRAHRQPITGGAIAILAGVVLGFVALSVGGLYALLNSRVTALGLLGIAVAVIGLAGLAVFWLRRSQ